MTERSELSKHTEVAKRHAAKNVLLLSVAKRTKARLLQEQYRQKVGTREISLEPVPEGQGLISDWITANGLPEVDGNAVIQRWQEQSTSVHDMILERVTSNLAINDGLLLVNESLQNTLKMSGVVLDVADIEETLELILKLEIANITLSTSNLTKLQKDMVFNTIMAGASTQINKGMALDALKEMLSATAHVKPKNRKG